MTWMLFILGSLCAWEGIARDDDPADPRRLGTIVRLAGGAIMMMMAIAWHSHK